MKKQLRQLLTLAMAVIVLFTSIPVESLAADSARATVFNADWDIKRGDSISAKDLLKLLRDNGYVTLRVQIKQGDDIKYTTGSGNWNPNTSGTYDVYCRQVSSYVKAGTLTIKLYDELTLDADVSTSGAVLSVNGGTQVDTTNVYKVFDSAAPSIVIPAKENYSITVNDVPFEGGTYPVTMGGKDQTVKIRYEKQTASTLNLTVDDTATVKLNGTTALTSGTHKLDLSSGGTFVVTPKEGYKITGIQFTDGAGTPKGDAVVTETDWTLSCPASENESYTMVVSTARTANTFKLSEATKQEIKDGNITSIKVGDTEFVYRALGSYVYDNTLDSVQTVNANAKVNVEVTLKSDRAVKTFTIGSTDCKDKGTKFEFQAGEGQDYVLLLETRGTNNTLVKDSAIEHVEVKENISFPPKELTSSISFAKGKEVTLTLTPLDGYYITSCSVKDGLGTECGTVTEGANGVKTITFTSGEAQTYTVYATVASFITAKADATFEWSEVKKTKDGKKTKEEFEAYIWNQAYEAPAGVDTANGVSVEYLVTEISLNTLLKNAGIDIGNFDLGSYKVWRGITEGVPTADTMAREILDMIRSTLGSVGTILIPDSKYEEYVAYIADALEGLDLSREFGSEKDVETIRAVYAGSANYPKTTVENTITKVDKRIPTVLDLKEEISVVYGSYTSMDGMLEQLLEEHLGVCVDDADGILPAGNDEEGIAYNTKLKIKENLVGKDVGEYTVTVVFPDDASYDYRGSQKEVTVKITKASAKVNVTSGVVKIADISELTKEDLITVTPGDEVVITDKHVDHISFIVGMEVVEGKVLAQLDLSQVTDDPLTMAALKAFVGSGKTVKLSDLSGIIEALANIGVVIGSEELTKLLEYLVQIQGALGADLEITISADGSIVPDSYGVYAVGAVTIDDNYNTAYGLGYLVIVVEPVEVYFENKQANRRFTYDGTPKAMRAYAVVGGEIIEDNLEDETDGFTYYYMGVQADGKLYNNAAAPTETGAYTVLAVYKDNPEKPNRMGMTVGTLIIKPAEASVFVEDFLAVPYTEAPVDIREKMITVDPEDAEIAVVLGSVSVQGDFSEEGLDSIVGNLNIDLPTSIDESIKTLLGKDLTETELTVTDFKKLVSNLKAALEQSETIKIDTAALDQLLKLLDEMPNVTSLTFKNDVKPSAIGAYFVGAVVFDSNYKAASNSGILLITPEVTVDELTWDYDLKGIVTLPVLEENDGLLAAAAATGADVKYLIIGTDEKGNEVRIHTADISYDSLVEKGFGNGVYTQVAYIPLEVARDFTIGYPIVRTFVVAPQNVLISFQPDLNIKNARAFKYTGSPIEVPTVVTYADGTTIPAEKLAANYTVTYTGVDSTGTAYESTTPPTNVGLYTVTAVYKEYNEKGELLYAGVNVGLMAITPADHVVSIDDVIVCCDCGCDCTVENIDSGCEHCKPDSYSLTPSVANQDIQTITVISDRNGNINVLVPADWKLNVENKSDEAIDELIAQITRLSGLADAHALSGKLDEAIKDLTDLKNAGSAYSEKELQEAIDKLNALLKDLEEDDKKAILAALAEEVKAIDGIDAELVEEIVAAINAVADAATEEETKAAADKAIALIEKISEQQLGEVAKLALKAIVVQLKAMDFSDIDAAVKANAKTVIEAAIKELTKIKELSAAAGKELDKVIEELTELKGKLTKAEDEVYSALGSLSAELQKLKETLGVIKTISINGELPSKCGIYDVTVIGFGANYKVATDTATLTIVGHDAVTDKGTAAGCLTDGLTDGSHCKRCNKVLKAQEKIPAHGHKWGKWYTTKKPTLTEQGEQRRDCGKCGAYELRRLDKLQDTNHGRNDGTSNGAGGTTNVTPVGTTKTGDTLRTGFWTTLAVVSAAMAVVLFFTRRKKAARR